MITKNSIVVERNKNNNCFLFNVRTLDRKQKSRRLCSGSATKRCMMYNETWGTCRETAQVSHSLCYDCGSNMWSQESKQIEDQFECLTIIIYALQTPRLCWISMGLLILLLISFIYSFILLLLFVFFFRYLQIVISLGILFGRKSRSTHDMSHSTWKSSTFKIRRHHFYFECRMTSK